jgi:GMP synthase-like glutamine amidotransferase
MPRITAIDCDSSKFPEIVDILTNAGGDCQAIPLDSANATDFEDTDGVVISGGPHLFTDAESADTLLAKFTFLDNLDCPAFGICLGYQAIAIRRGARVFLGEARRETDAIRMVTTHPLMAGIPDGTHFREDHCEGVDLPEGFTRLGASEHYEAEAIADDRRRQYGVQFHPEVSGEPGRQLLTNFVQMLRTEA